MHPVCTKPGENPKRYPRLALSWLAPSIAWYELAIFPDWSSVLSHDVSQLSLTNLAYMKFCGWSVKSHHLSCAGGHFRTRTGFEATADSSQPIAYRIDWPRRRAGRRHAHCYAPRKRSAGLRSSPYHPPRLHSPGWQAERAPAQPRSGRPHGGHAQYTPSWILAEMADTRLRFLRAFDGRPTLTRPVSIHYHDAC